MQYAIRPDGTGASVSGTISFSSKDAYFKVKVDYTAGFDITGGFQGKEEEAMRDRYLTVTGQEIYKKWRTTEAKVVAALTKNLNKEEKDFKKKLKKIKSLDALVLKREMQENLSREAGDELNAQFTAIVKSGHAAGVKALGKDAAKGLKSKGRIAYKAVVSVGKFAFDVAGAVAAGAAVGAAAGPVGAAAGATIAIGAVVFKSIKALATAKANYTSLRIAFNGNYKSYRASIEKLDKQLKETIVLSRSLTAKWDGLMMEQRHMEKLLADAEAAFPAAVQGSSDYKDVQSKRARLEKVNKSLGKIKDFKPASMEKALSGLQYQIYQECLPDEELGHMAKFSKDHADALDDWGGAAGSVATLMDKGGAMISKAGKLVNSVGNAFN